MTRETSGTSLPGMPMSLGFDIDTIRGTLLENKSGDVSIPWCGGGG
jgi:hypothetical protein